MPSRAPPRRRAVPAERVRRCDRAIGGASKARGAFDRTQKLTTALANDQSAARAMRGGRQHVLSQGQPDLRAVTSAQTSALCATLARLEAVARPPINRAFACGKATITDFRHDFPKPVWMRAALQPRPIPAIPCADPRRRFLLLPLAGPAGLKHHRLLSRQLRASRGLCWLLHLDGGCRSWTRAGWPAVLACGLLWSLALRTPAGGSDESAVGCCCC